MMAKSKSKSIKSDAANSTHDSTENEQGLDAKSSGENGNHLAKSDNLENDQPEDTNASLENENAVHTNGSGQNEQAVDTIDNDNGDELANVTFEAVDDTEIQLQETSIAEDDLSEYFVSRTYSEMKSMIQEHSEKTFATYCVQRRTKHFGKDAKDIDFKNHKITWCEPNLPSTFKHDFFNFDGTPYMTVGMYYLHCQFGQDLQTTRKEKYKKMRESGEIVVSHQRFGAQQKTKKCGCPAVIAVKHVVKFPDYETDEKVQRTKHYKRIINKKLRTDLDDKVDMKMESYYIGKLPHISQHKFHELLLGSENQKESIHKDLKIMAQEMNFKELKIAEIHSKLQKHVLENWFYKEEPPALSHRKYFPFKHDLRNMRSRILRLCEFTDAEIESLEEVIQLLQKQDPCSNIIFQMENIDENSMKNVDDDFFNEPTPKRKRYERKTQPSPPKNYKSFFFLNQSSKQQQLLLRYGSLVYITELENNKNVTRALTFRMFLLLVQTNVDFQVVGCFAFSKLKQAVSLGDCLQRFKSSNMQWAPKHFIGDCSDEISSAVENVFAESEYFFSLSSCRKKWLQFIATPYNELSQNSDEILTYMESMATSYTKEALTASATLMELSNVWNCSTALQNWFQSDWLLSAKRWVQAYRPDDLRLFNHGHAEFEETVRLYEGIMSDSTCLYAQAGFIKMVKRIGNEASTKDYERYVKLNHQLFTKCQHLSSLMIKLQPTLGIPSYLFPIYEEIRHDLETNQFQIDIQQVGIFKVKQQNEVEDESDSQLVIFGSSKNYPSCTCPKWHKDNVPCLHMFVIFKHLPGWKYDSLSIAYRMNPIFEVDYACLESSSLELSNQVDAETQTEEEVDNERDKVNVSQQKEFGRMFKPVEKVDCSEKMIVKLKSFRSQMKDLSDLFVEKQYQSLLETDLDVLINELENKALNSDGSTLRQTPQHFVSLGCVMKQKIASGLQKGSSKSAANQENVDKSKVIMLAKQRQNNKKVLAKQSTFGSHSKKALHTS